MKSICAVILALAASSSAMAEKADPTATCIESLAAEPGLRVLADKVALARSNNANPTRVANRMASEQERAAVGLWHGKRQQCFDAGAGFRRATSTSQEIAFVRSLFALQQQLVAGLQDGRLTYAEFNRRRLELIEAAGGQEI
jgi:hypothetical protein